MLVASDRAACTTHFIIDALDKKHVLALLRLLLAQKTLVGSYGCKALAAMAKYISAAHHPVNLSAETRVNGPWHVRT